MAWWRHDVVALRRHGGVELTCALAAHQVLALRLVGVDGRDGDGILGVGVQVLQEVGGLLAAHEGLEAEGRRHVGGPVLPAGPEGGLGHLGELQVLGGRNYVCSTENQGHQEVKERGVRRSPVLAVPSSGAAGPRAYSGVTATAYSVWESRPDRSTAVAPPPTSTCRSEVRGQRSR
ncbi:hypothetical protein EYF80_050708 [Liparis tanakae]|uniref:Uncharacterized protein n=1 Tax=Liparis tanakae TaxID=230148 RepID=A0A4Z2FEF5_9TELE|nr:hypothetical protein EYF80_050708 [Liparis tanakae]